MNNKRKKSKEDRTKKEIFGKQQDIICNRKRKNNTYNLRKL